MGSDRSDQVIVVGAGIAGVSAAHRLASAGFQVSVLEAAHELGGRISTRTVEGALLERGAQFLSTGYEVIPGLLQTLGLADQIVEVSGRSMVVADGRAWRFDIDRPQSLLSGGLLRVRDVVPATWGAWSTRKLATRPTSDLGRWTDLDMQSGLGWAEARFGPGLTHRLLSPAVQGLYFQELAAGSAALPGALAAFSARAASFFTLRGRVGSAYRGPGGEGGR